MKLYYWAAQLRAAMFYFPTAEVPAWIEIEKTTSELPLHSYLYSSQTKNLIRHTHNPFVKNTVAIWHEAHTFLNEKTKLSGFAPIWGNDNFKPGRSDMGFKQWMNRGLGMIKDLYSEGTLMSFQQLIDRYDLPRKHHFKYLQIRSFIYSQTKSLAEPSLSTIESLTIKHLYDRGQLSMFYEVLLDGSKENSDSYLSAWKNDLQLDISAEEWEGACESAQTQTISTRCKLLQYKWLLRTYITPVKLHRFNPNIPDDCFKCGEEIGTMFHCMWGCKELQIYWKEVCELIARMIN